MQVELKKEAEQRDLVNKLEKVQTAKINEMENIEVKNPQLLIDYNNNRKLIFRKIMKILSMR